MIQTTLSAVMTARVLVAAMFSTRDHREEELQLDPASLHCLDHLVWELQLNVWTATKFLTALNQKFRRPQQVQTVTRMFVITSARNQEDVK